MFSLGSAFNAEKPIIFFDSHPEPPAGIVWNSIDHVKKQLYIAWTGDVVLDVQPGLLRLQWWTDEGKFGKKDYEIREFEDVRTAFEELQKLPEVGRCQIVGFPSQNPYSIYGESPYAQSERQKREILESAQYRDFVPRTKKEPSVGQQIDQIINNEDKRAAVVQQQSVGTEEV